MYLCVGLSLSSMFFSRRIQREKALQSLYAYLQRRSAMLSELERMGEEDHIRADPEKAAALFDLRGHLYQHIYTAEPSEQTLQTQAEDRSSTYQAFYRETLLLYARCSRDELQTTLRLYDGAMQQFLLSYYLLIALYLSLAEYSRASCARLGQSPILAALEKEGYVLSELQRARLPAFSSDILKACYARLGDGPVLQKLPSWTEDARYLVSLSRGRWLSTPLLSEWMATRDRCWSAHKLLLRQMLMHTFKNFQKDSPHISILPENSTTLAKQTCFGRELCEKSVVSYLRWSKQIAEQSPNWSLQRISLVDRSLLVLALTEIIEMKVPLPVSMNEYIEIAKIYGSSKSASFVNGLLEGTVKHLQSSSLEKTIQTTH